MYSNKFAAKLMNTRQLCKEDVEKLSIFIVLSTYYLTFRLVTVFNHQVGNTGWSNMRAYHDQALIDEFKRRGIDVSAIYDGKSISFAHSVRYDIADNRFVVSD